MKRMLSALVLLLGLMGGGVNARSTCFVINHTDHNLTYGMRVRRFRPSCNDLHHVRNNVSLPSGATQEVIINSGYGVADYAANITSMGNKRTTRDIPCDQMTNRDTYVRFFYEDGKLTNTIQISPH
jgi:hypothetical protein